MKHTEIVCVDDLDGSEPARTVAFAVDGKTFEIDLSAVNEERLRDALKPFLTAARRTPGGARRRPPVRESPAAVRAWAAARGIVVADRGRIPAAVWDAYRAGLNR